MPSAKIEICTPLESAVVVMDLIVVEARPCARAALDEASSRRARNKRFIVDTELKLKRNNSVILKGRYPRPTFLLDSSGRIAPLGMTK